MNVGILINTTNIIVTKFTVYFITIDRHIFIIKNFINVKSNVLETLKFYLKEMGI